MRHGTDFDFHIGVARDIDDAERKLVKHKAPRPTMEERPATWRFANSVYGSIEFSEKCCRHSGFFEQYQARDASASSAARG
jgi:hypothetical protein